jgi:hypothetical protein
MARTAACKAIKIHRTFDSDVNDTGEQWRQLKKCLSHCTRVAPAESPYPFSFSDAARRPAELSAAMLPRSPIPCGPYHRWSRLSMSCIFC